MMRSASPRNELITAATAVSFLDDENGDLIEPDGTLSEVIVAFAVTVFVTVDLAMAAVVVFVVVIVTVSALLGSVEPDVRLKMIWPASTEKGEKLPLVLVRQVLLNGFMLPQQNMLVPSTSTR